MGFHGVATEHQENAIEQRIDSHFVEASQGVAVLATMYRDAVAKRGDSPSTLLVADDSLRDALRSELGIGVAISAGFDQRAQDLSEAAASAAEIASNAEAMLKESKAEQREKQMLARMHQTVEAQLAENDPPEVAQALERLERAGIPRDQAIHTIAGVFLRIMSASLKNGVPFDAAAYAAALGKLTTAATNR